MTYANGCVVGARRVCSSRVMCGLSFNTLCLLLPVALAAAVGVLGADQYDRADFPADFVFGAGTAAYQYEGAALTDGRTPGVWDTFVHSDRFDGATGDVTCDGYHKYKATQPLQEDIKLMSDMGLEAFRFTIFCMKATQPLQEDIKLMSDMGLEAFRFTISWSRLIPNGRGPVNPLGLRFYNNFINELISHGIQPHVALHHADLPQVLEDEYDGWISRKIVKDFTAYADVCFREFGDRVLYWTPVNEANIFAIGGYDQGLMPPGRCSIPFSNLCSKGNSTTEPYLVGHNILLAHSAVVELYKEKYKATQKGYIGFNIYNLWMVPYSNSKEDAIATQRANDFYTGWLLNPLIFGDYPEIVKKNAGTRIPAFTKDELEQIKGAFDFIGVNHYSTVLVKDYPAALQTANRDLLADIAVELKLVVEKRPPLPLPDEYPVHPWGLYGLLEYLKRVYGNPPVYVHENGQRTRRNQTLDDTTRVDYLHGYIGAMLDAMRNGSNTKGYFTWSLLDCLELLDGFDSSFGMCYVDLDDKDLKRYPKLSARWYSNFLNGKSILPRNLTKLGDKYSSVFL